MRSVTPRGLPHFIRCKRAEWPVLSPDKTHTNTGLRAEMSGKSSNPLIF